MRLVLFLWLVCHSSYRLLNEQMTMRMIFSFIVFTFLLTKTHQQITDNWIDYDSSPEIDSDRYLEAFTRDDEEELEVYSPIQTGFKYISGGAGEGRQHLSPDGNFPNRQEIKTDEELPLFCHPPNPCPLGVQGKSFESNRIESIFGRFSADDCDPSPMSMFTADYSRWYQNEQRCSCDSDHDQCSMPTPSKNILKRSRRTRNVSYLCYQSQSLKKLFLLFFFLHFSRDFHLINNSKRIQ